MPEAIGLVYCTVLRVYILPEDLADSEHPVYLRISMYWRAGANSLKRRFFVRRASAHASILRASRYTSLNTMYNRKGQRTSYP